MHLNFELKHYIIHTAIKILVLLTILANSSTFSFFPNNPLTIIIFIYILSFLLSYIIQTSCNICYIYLLKKYVRTYHVYIRYFMYDLGEIHAFRLISCFFTFITNLFFNIIIWYLLLISRQVNIQNEFSQYINIHTWIYFAINWS